MARPRKTDLRDKILSAAADKFFRLGFSRVSIDEIVAEVRTSKSVVYKHFSSKEDLVLAVLTSLNEDINKNISSIVNNDSLTFQQKLENIISFTSGILQKVSKDFLNDLRIDTPTIWSKYQQMRSERLKTLYRSLFKQGIQQSIIRKDISLDFILFIYTKLTELVVDPSALDPIKVDSKKAYNMVSRLFLEGAKPK